MLKSYRDFLRARMEHEYTGEEIDQLFSVIEDAAERHAAIDMYKIEHILRPGDLVLVGFGSNVAYDVQFEIRGLRWTYDGETYSAHISPRKRYGGMPGVEWYVPITVSEGTGSSWSRTHMLRRQYRCMDLFEGNDELKTESTKKMFEQFYGKPFETITQDDIDRAAGTGRGDDAGQA